MILRLEFLNSLQKPIEGASKQITANTTSTDWKFNSFETRAPLGTRYVRVSIIAKRRTDGGCIDVLFDPTVVVDAVKLQWEV